MSPRAWGRRDFLLSLGGGALSLGVAEETWPAGLRRMIRMGMEGIRHPSGIRRVRMGCVLPAENAGRSSGTEAGILLGREESEEVGALLGVKLDVQVERVERPDEVDAAGARLIASGVQVMVGAVEPRASRALGRATSQAGVLFVDIGLSSDTPSTATDSPCGPPAFRVGVDPATGLGLVLEALAMEAPDAPIAPGGTILLVGNPDDPQLARSRETLTRRGGETRILDASSPARALSDALRSVGGAGASVAPRVLLVGPAALPWAFRPGALEAVDFVLATVPIPAQGPRPLVPVHAPTLWHPGLIRFGAAQLNERHERRFGTLMDPSAWAGWFGVKLLWEAALREGAGGNESPLEDRLIDPATRFDGHKGVGLGFRSDGLLRQPLYLVRTDPDGGSEVVHEGPDAPRGTPFVAAFDSLGPAESPCRYGGADPAPTAPPAP